MRQSKPLQGDTEVAKEWMWQATGEPTRPLRPLCHDLLLPQMHAQVCPAQLLPAWEKHTPQWKEQLRVASWLLQVTAYPHSSKVTLT